MAWAYVQTITDTTYEEYERVVAALDNNTPEGLLVHAAGTYGDAVRIIDVWESEEHFTRFREQQLAGALREAAGRHAGAAYPPSLEPMEVRHLVLGH
jgi:heme-degrading monooxygenase HmoA